MKKASPKSSPEAPRRSQTVRRRSATAEILGFTNVAGPVGKAKPVPQKWRENYRNLLRLRADLRQQSGHLTELAREESPASSMHMADAASDSFDRDFALSLLSSEQDALQEIEAAIKRIEQDEYGRCEITGKPIPKARLDAVPWTRYTVAAARQLERDSTVSIAQFAPRGSVGDANESPESTEEAEE